MGDIWAGLVSQRLSDYIGVTTNPNDNVDILVTAFSKRASSMPYYNVRICTDKIGPYYRIRGVTPDTFAKALIKPLPDLFLIWSPNAEFAFVHIRAFDDKDSFGVMSALRNLSNTNPNACLDIDPCDAYTSAFCCQTRSARVPSGDMNTKNNKRFKQSAHGNVFQSVFYYTILISTLGVVSLMLFLVVLRMKSFPRWKLINSDSV